MQGPEHSLRGRQWNGDGLGVFDGRSVGGDDYDAGVEGDDAVDDTVD